MLASTSSEMSLTVNASCRTSVSRSAARIASFESVVHRSTANSSPPSRATESPARSVVLKRSRDLTQQQVSVLVTERVVDVLEPVEVDQHHGDLVTGAPRGP